MKILRFAIFFAILFILFRFVFIFRKINCFSENVSIENGVCEQIEDNFRNKSLFFTDVENDQIWDRLLAEEKYTQVYQYQGIEKSILGEANLFLLAKAPDYRLILGQKRYLLNQNNKLKNDQDRLVLPSIEFMGEPSLEDHGYLQEDYHKKFLSLSQALQNYQINTERIIWQSNQEIHVFLKEIEIILDDSKNFNYNVERLSLVLKEDKIKTILPTKKILDMRFNLPVLK